MNQAAKKQISTELLNLGLIDLDSHLPPEFRNIDDIQSAIPRLARDKGAVAAIERAVHAVPTAHRLFLGDARDMSWVQPESVHLILTSPPYWTLKEYRDSSGQIGHIEDYNEFLAELDRVWTHCLG